MRYAIKVGILACTLGFAAAGGIAPEPPVHKPDFQDRSAPKLPPLEPSQQEPSQDPSKDQKLPGKGLNPAETQAFPEDNEPAETPASTETLDCDNCLIAQHAEEESLPMAMAKTLWGFFFVGRPRLNIKPEPGTVSPQLPG